MSMRSSVGTTSREMFRDFLSSTPHIQLTDNLQRLMLEGEQNPKLFIVLKQHVFFYFFFNLKTLVACCHEGSIAVGRNPHCEHSSLVAFSIKLASRRTRALIPK